MRMNPDTGRPHTWIAYGIKSGEPVTVDDQTFDPKQHVNKDKGEIAYQKSLKKGTAAVEEETVEVEDARSDRAKELKAMSADEVKDVAAAVGVEYTNKGDSIDAILAAEFPE